MSNNYLKNLSTNSGIKTSTLKTLNQYELMTIKNEVELEKLSGEQKIFSFETQYGVFQVNCEDLKNLKFKFTPTTQLKNTIISSLTTNGVSMSTKLEKTLTEELFTFYSSLF